LESELNAAKAAATQAEAMLKEKEAQWGQMEQELAGLRQTRDEFQESFQSNKKRRPSPTGAQGTPGSV